MSETDTETLVKMLEALDDKTVMNLLRAAILQAMAASTVIQKRIRG